MHSLPGKRAVSVFLAVAALMLLPLAAQADFVLLGSSFSIVSPNEALAPYTGPYLNVDVTGSGAVAYFDVQSLTVDNRLYLFGSNKALGLNFNIPTGDHVSLSSFVGTPWKNSDTIDQKGSNNYSEFGVMNTTVSIGDGYKSTLKRLTFTATLLDGFNNPVSFPGGIVLVDNSKEFFAAAHIYVQNLADTKNAVTTGFAGDGNQTVVIPLPPAVWLFGSGLIGVGLLGWRRKKA